MAEDLDKLEASVLGLINDGRSLEDIAKLVRAPGATLGRTIGKLQLKGYLAEDGSISARGIQALARELSSPDRH
jgi:DNA-binding IclR family transcriptional regulator